MSFIRLTSENGRPTLINLALVTDVRPASDYRATGTELYLTLFAPNGDQVYISVQESFAVVSMLIKELHDDQADTEAGA